MRKILVETDFLFGLNKRDNLYPIVIELLRRHKRGKVDLAVSSAAPLEVSLVLLSRGFSLDTIAKVLELMDMKLAEYKVNNFIPIGLDTTIRSLELRNKYEKLTFFDSIHIAIAATTGFTLLTSDMIMKTVMEAEGISYIDYEDVKQYFP